MPMSAKELAKEISDFVNSAYSSDVNELVKEMVNDHRTLIQLKANLVHKFVEELALLYKDHNYDQRNEDAVLWAKKVMNV